MIYKILKAISLNLSGDTPVAENPKQNLQEQIRELAYRKWEEAGRPLGKDKEFWTEAERQLFGQEDPFEPTIEFNAESP